MRRMLAWTAAGAVVVVAGGIALHRAVHPRAPPPPPPPPAANDTFGDPLPPYAVARMGTIRRPIATCGLAFTPNSRALACGCGDGFVRRFDVATGAMIDETRVRGGFATIPRYRGPMSWLTDAFQSHRDEMVPDLPWQMAFSDDGSRIATIGAARASLTEPHASQHFSREGARPSALAMAKDGSFAVFGWDDGLIQLVPSGPRARTIELVKGAVQGIALSPDGRLAALQGQGGIRLVELATGTALASASPDKAFSPRAAAFSPDGTRLVHAQGRNSLVLRDVKSFAVLWEISDAKRINWGDAVFSPDGRTIAWGMNDVVLVDAATGAVSRVLGTGGVETSKLVFSPDGTRLAATAAGVVRLWDTTTWAETLPVAPPASGVHALEFSPDGRALLTRGRGRSLDVWDAATGALRWSIAREGWNGDAAWSPDGSSVRCAIWNPEKTDLVTLDAASGAPTDSVELPKYARFALHGAAPLMLRFTPTGRSSGTWDLVDPKTCASVRTLQGSTIGGLAVYSRDGRFLASTTGSAPLDLLDLTTGTSAPSGATWSNNDGIARLVAVSPDASFVAVAIEHGRVLVVERATGRTRFSADSGLHGAATSLAISPDGRLLAIGDPFGAVHLWSVADEIELLAFSGHRGGVGAVEFSPDGSRLASGSDDATVLVWDVGGFGKAR